MTPPSSHRMSEACLLLMQQGPLKRSNMAPSRGKLDSNSTEKNNNRTDAVSASVSGPSLPQAEIQRSLSPVLECRVVTDVADTSEGSEMRTFFSNQGQKSLPGSPTDRQPGCDVSSGSFSLPQRQPPLDNELSEMETGEEETSRGSASSPLKSNEPSVPQHEMGDSSKTEEESKCTAMIKRNKTILLQGLTLTYRVGSLTLVSVLFGGFV